MNLARCLENALENIEKTLKINELRRMVEDSNRIHMDLVLVQRHVDTQVRVKEREMLERLRVHRCLGRLKESIMGLAIQYATVLRHEQRSFNSICENDMKDILRQKDEEIARLEVEYNDDIGDIRREYQKQRISASLCNFGKNVSVVARILRIHNEMSSVVMGDSSICGASEVVDIETKESVSDMRLELKDKSLRIQNALLSLRRGMVDKEASLGERVVDRVLLVLSQGSLENDVRFAELIDQTLRDMEKFEAPEIARMSVQFVIAKKYVEDMISLKEDCFLREYLDME